MPDLFVSGPRDSYIALCDRADGVRGHFCLGRLRTIDATWEFWNEKRGWCSAGTIYIGRKKAEARRAELDRLPSFGGKMIKKRKESPKREEAPVLSIGPGYPPWYMYVFHACGHYGMTLPWAEWMCYGLWPTFEGDKADFFIFSIEGQLDTSIRESMLRWQVSIKEGDLRKICIDHSGFREEGLRIVYWDVLRRHLQRLHQELGPLVPRENTHG